MVPLYAIDGIREAFLGRLSPDMSYTAVLVYFGCRMPLMSPSPRPLCFQLRQALGITQLACGCFPEPAHPPFDEGFLVALVDGHERPRNLISVRSRGYS